MNIVKNLLRACGLGAATVLAYALMVEPYDIRIERITIPCPRLPEEFDNYVILQISDPHMRTFGRRERKIESMVAGLGKCDLIAVTGDMVHTRNGVDAFERLIPSLKSRDGVFAIYGNSEHKNGVDSDNLTTRLTAAGVTVLVNQSAIVNRGNARIAVIGVDDPATEHEDFDAAFRTVPHDVFRLLLMHSPDAITAAWAAGADVVLSGHTHGGQVHFPLIGAPLTHSWLGGKMNSGYYQGYRLQNILGVRPGRTRLYVSRGVGVSGLAIRFLCPPEIAVITLKSV